MHGIGLGVLFHNSRLNDLKNYVDAKFAATDKRLDDLKDFIRSEVHRLEDRMERLKRPITGLHPRFAGCGISAAPPLAPDSETTIAI
jgi:hypothetical protein